MRNLPGWVSGALGVGAIVGAFYLGGRASATDAPAASPEVTGVTASAPAATALEAAELAVECEPGQRAVVRTSTGATPSVACMSEARPVALGSQVAQHAYAPATTAPSGIVRVADRERPYARPAVLREPTEVYRPRARTASYDVEAPKRSVQKSVAIIAGSTAVGAVAGGLVKGKKGAVVGGLLGGGAATVWDQVTRRQNDR